MLMLSALEMMLSDERRTHSVTAGMLDFMIALVVGLGIDWSLVCMPSLCERGHKQAKLEGM